MGFINLEKKYVFIHVPRCGGTSMADALGGNSSHFKIGYLRGFFDKGVIKGVEWSSLFKFAFVRNPYDRLVSAFMFNKNDPNNRSFKEFVFDMYLNNEPHGSDYNPIYYHPVYQPQTLYLYYNGVCEMNFLGRFENMAEDWKKVCDKIGEKVELPHKNASRHNDWENYYDSETKKWVQSIFMADFKNFGYDL